MRKIVFVLAIAFSVANASYSLTKVVNKERILAAPNDSLTAIHANVVPVDSMAIDSSLTVIENHVDSVVVQENDSVKLPLITPPKNATATQEDTSKVIIQIKNDKVESIEDKTLLINDISFVLPVKDLITFFDKESNTLSGIIKEWDQQIKKSIVSINLIKEKNLQIENELTEKKNADSKGYTNEIITLKKNLTESRGNYKISKNKILSDGLNIINKLKTIGKELDGSVNDKFNDISRAVKSSNPKPSTAIISQSTPTPISKIDLDVINYINPTKELLFFCQNEMISLQNTIILWNKKAEDIIHQDTGLSMKLELLKMELEKSEMNKKQNKADISLLKKQIAAIDKDRKKLAKQMDADSSELSSYLKQNCAEVKNTLKERFIDIIENINYTYQENLNL